MKSVRNRLDHPYAVLVLICIFMIVFALFLDGPMDILQGVRKIFVSRGILITDYIELAGRGAALVNAATVGIFSVVLMKLAKVAPSGAIIMAVWLNCGFAFFGKNILNMLPLIAGVWLYSRLRKEPFANFSLTALLSATLAPVVSEIALGNSFGSLEEIFLAITGKKGRCNMEATRKHFFGDMRIMLGRSMRHIFRSADTIITIAITPIAMMLLFPMTCAPR